MGVHVTELIPCASTIEWPWDGFHVLAADKVGDLMSFRAHFKYRRGPCRHFGRMIWTAIPPCLYARAVDEGATAITRADLDVVMVDAIDTPPDDD